MKKTFYIAAAAAALLMVSTAAQAGSGFSFEIDGQKIHIDAPRNCNSLSCLSITNNGSAVNMKNLNGKKSNADDEVATNAPPPPAPAAIPAPPSPAAVPAPPAPAAVPAPPAPAATQVAKIVPPAPPAPPAAGTTTTLTGTGFEPAKSQTSNTADPSRERVTGLTSTLVANPAPAAAAPVVTAAPAIVPAPAAVAPAVPSAPPVQQQEDATTPLGLWATEDNKGNVRIEQCGANLCGYAEKTKEQILINMKPSQNKWVGRIHDPDSGSNYDSTIAMKGPNVLKVQGCAFGGMFCGGQTWKRV
jgi:uncharacterized protein (DUF2147 family)